MAQLNLANGDHSNDVFAPQVRELEKRATSLDNNQPFGDPKMIVTQNLPPARRQAGASGPQDNDGANYNEKLESIKNWSISTFKCTKQKLSEKLGKTTPTTDPRVDKQVAELRETQKYYQHVLNLTQNMVRHFAAMLANQRLLADSFQDLARRETDLVEEFTCNCETQRILVKNGDQLLAALTFFCSTVNTLVTKTIEDTFLTISNYESARVEYDAYRTDMEHLQANPNVFRDSTTVSKAEETKKKCETLSKKYERLKEDVSVKIRFLEENKVRVMQKQLLLFHNAISAYFSGNQGALESTMKQFSLYPKTGSQAKQAWLEQEN